MTEIKLTLDYQLNSGWLQPFTEGLVSGQAVAWRCTDCQRTSFPPLRTCSCGQSTGEWTPLSGEAEIQYLTQGVDGAFALARFKGADTSTVVKLQFADLANDWILAESSSTLTGRLRPLDGACPELVLHVNPVKK